MVIGCGDSVADISVDLASVRWSLGQLSWGPALYSKRCKLEIKQRSFNFRMARLLDLFGTL